jgi:hypothetical protein
VLREEDSGRSKSAVGHPRSAVFKSPHPLRPVFAFAFALSRLSPRGLLDQRCLMNRKFCISYQQWSRGGLSGSPIATNKIDIP